MMSGSARERGGWRPGSYGQRKHPSDAVVHHLFDDLEVDLRTLIAETIYKGRIAQNVDQPWDTTCAFMYQGERVRCEQLLTSSSHTDPVPYVADRFLELQCFEMVIDDDALRELTQTLEAQGVPQLRLPDQNGLQQQLLAG